MQDVLQMPVASQWQVRRRAMVRQAAKSVGANPDGRFRWLGFVGWLSGIALSIGSLVLAYGVWRGRTEAKQDIYADNQKAVSALISASESRLTKAADELRLSARDMRVELNGKLDQIDAKAESIRGSVATQQAQIEGLKARLEAANEDKARLWQQIETYNLKLERLERQLRSGGAPPNGG